MCFYTLNVNSDQHKLIIWRVFYQKWCPKFYSVLKQASTLSMWVKLTQHCTEVEHSQNF